MHFPRLILLVATAAVAAAVSGCRTRETSTGETSTGLPYRPPGKSYYVEPPEGFVAPEPGLPLTERRYLPPTPEIEAVPASARRTISTPTGPVVQTKSQSPVDVSLPENEWVQAASGWRGAPYREGGTSRDGVDCSGLIQQLYLEVRNQDIPRTTTEQWARSSSTGIAPVQPGDLVFFNTRRIFGDETTHAGLVVGNRVFVHASTSSGVTYGSLDDPYWSKRFTGSRRFVQ